MSNTSTITFPYPVEVPKLWGRELHLFNGPDFCGKFLDFHAGFKGSLHFHALKHEAWVILSGSIELSYPDPKTGQGCVARLTVGQLVDIPRHCPHQVTALEDTRIVEFSTEDFATDSYRITPSAAAPQEVRS